MRTRTRATRWAAPRKQRAAQEHVYQPSTTHPSHSQHKQRPHRRTTSPTPPHTRPHSNLPTHTQHYVHTHPRPHPQTHIHTHTKITNIAAHELASPKRNANVHGGAHHSCSAPDVAHEAVRPAVTPMIRTGSPSDWDMLQTRSEKPSKPIHYDKSRPSILPRTSARHRRHRYYSHISTHSHNLDTRTPYGAQERLPAQPPRQTPSYEASPTPMAPVAQSRTHAPTCTHVHVHRRMYHCVGERDPA